MHCDANVIGANSILFLIAIKLGAANAKLRDQVLCALGWITGVAPVGPAK